MFSAQSGVSLTYEKIQVSEEGFAETADRFLETGYGFNVTLPCKFDACRYVDELTPEAALGEAVNTVSRLPDDRLLGSNTDGRGLVNDLVQNLGWEISGRKLLVVGAGGAVSGALPALLSEQPASVHLVNRTHQRARDLAARLDNPCLEARPVDDLDEGYDLVINGTAASLAGQAPDLPQRIIAAGTCCYDMMYGAEITAFNRWCESLGSRNLSDGLGMLVEQAGLAFTIWFDREIETGPVLAALRTSLLTSKARNP